MIERHKKTLSRNFYRVVICPLLYAPKFSDKRLPKTENFTSKIKAVNEWIVDFNKKSTGLHVDLDKYGIKEVPKNDNLEVQHIYEAWNEPQWDRMLHLNPETKSKVALEIIEVFKQM